MRRLVVPVVLALAMAACGGEEVPLPTGSPAGPSPSPPTAGPPSETPPASPASPASPPPSPAPQPDVRLPADLPDALADPAALARIAAGDLAPLAPPGSSLTFTDVLALPGDPVDRVALAWRRGQDPFASELGLVVWQRPDGSQTWRAVYAFTDRPRRGVLGISVQTGDLTGDRVPDLLTLEQVGGSGACGTWRVVSSSPGDAQEVFRRKTCDTEIVIGAGALQVREAVYEPDDAHCCPSAFRYTTLAWDGTRFVQTASRVEPT